MTIYLRFTHIPFFNLFIVILLGLTLVNNKTAAQDANYWTFQYGSRSTLLGGAVIGSVLDLSGTYYNPGAVSLIKDPETVLAAKVFEYPQYTLEGSFLNNIEMSSSNIRPAPSLVATNLKFDWLGENILVISFLTRHDLNFDLYYSDNFKLDFDTIKDIIVNTRVQERMSESWFGITWSHNYGSKIGIGVTPYFIFRSHNTFINMNSQGVSMVEDLSLIFDSREFNYDHYSIILKAGITFDFIGHTIGLTITTPRLGYYGNGSSGLNRTIYGENINYVAADYQNDVNAEYKSPFSVAIGTTLKIDQTNIYVSAEWFSAIETYDVITPRMYQPQIGSDTLFNGVISAAKSVVNFGVGIQHTFTNSNTLNASITTDYSASVPESDTNLSFASWDIYHFMVGGSLKLLDSEITLGLGYAFGSKKTKTNSEAPPAVFTSSSINAFSGVKFSYHSYKLIFGFAF